MDNFNCAELNNPLLQTETLSPEQGKSSFNTEFTNLLTKFEISTYINDDFFKIPTDNQTWGRESVALLKDIDICGKESLGILELDALNFSFNNDNRNIQSDMCVSKLIISEDQKLNSPLNTAFLHPFSYRNNKKSVLSSCSSGSTNPSLFNSASLEASEPSKIYSLNNTKGFNLASKSDDILNDAFINTFGSKLKLSSVSINNSSCFENATNSLKDLNESRQRLLSLPKLESVETKNREDYVKPEGSKNICLGHEYLRWSESEAGFAKTTALRKQTYVIDSKDALFDQLVDETFNDSVFIEAKHLASKIADGSICCSFEENLLDCTSPPCFKDVQEPEPNDMKVDAKKVFNVIDKMLPPQQSISSKSELDKKSVNSSVPKDANVNRNVEVSESDVAVNVLSFCQNGQNHTFTKTEFKQYSENMCDNKNINSSQKQSSSHSSSSSNSDGSKRNAYELIQDLSEIINHEFGDSKQRIEAQQLLSRLAILCSAVSNPSLGKGDNLEVSGHSCIEPDEQQNDQETYSGCKVLDLRVAASKSSDNEQILDLSMKSKVENANKRLSQSFSFPSPKLLPIKLFDSLKKSQCSSKSSTASLELGKDKLKSDTQKLKPKNIDEKTDGIKKGPLKAIIPLTNMSKRKSFSKMEPTQSTLFKVKRTSTPISEPQLKPVAQSTPDDSKPAMDRSRPISCSSQLKKRKFYCPVSPLVRPSSIGDSNANMELNRSSRSGSTPNLSNQSGNSKRDSFIPSPKPMLRRHSATELKAAENSSMKLRRTYSIGRDVKTASTISKVKENIRSALSNTSVKGSATKISKSTNQKNVLQDSNSRTTSYIKRISLIGRLKKSGDKENIGH